MRNKPASEKNFLNPIRACLKAARYPAARVSQKDVSMLGLQTFDENVSAVDGPPVRAVGVTFTTRMIVVKLTDGSLWVNSPVSVPLDMLDRNIASGPVRYLVAPTRMHVWRLEAWRALFPELNSGDRLKYRISSNACHPPAFWETRRLKIGRMTLFSLRVESGSAAAAQE